MSQEGAQLFSTFEQLGYQIGRTMAAGRTPPAAAPRQAAKRPAGRPGSLRIGSRVWYRQGRGEFAARVLRVNESQGVATLERLKDFKRVLRPLAKIYPAPRAR